MSGSRTSTQILTSALVLLTVLGSAAGYCTYGSEWIEYNGGCYRWSRAAANWFSSELDCGRHGGHLVSISSPGDNNFLLRLTQCSNSFWIGMVNTVHSLKAQVKGYEWWDRTPHNYTMLTAKGTDYHDCVHSDLSGKWHNNYCQSGLGYVCKAPAVRGSEEDFQDSEKLLGVEDPEVNAVWWWTTAERRTTSIRYTEDTTEGLDYTTESEVTDASTTPDSSPSSAASTERTAYPEEVTLGETADRSTASTTTESGQTTRLTPDRSRPTTPSTLKCPSGWQQLDRSCYFVSDGRTNYFNAQMSCQALDGNVASVLTLREHTLLTVALGCNSPVWIGLEKARPCFKQPNRDHCWVWMDRSPVNYFEWAPNHPVDRIDSECVILDGQWKVLNCYSEFRYVCKKPL